MHDAQRGLYRNRRGAFTDPDLFELEMKYIFEGNWIYLAHESQLPNNNDYLTVYMGRQPVVISRDKNGELHALINACSHKGAMLCRRKKDKRSTFTCPFHVSSHGYFRVDHAVWGGIQGLAARASRMASTGRRPWLRALTNAEAQVVSMPTIGPIHADHDRCHRHSIASRCSLVPDLTSGQWRRRSQLGCARQPTHEGPRGAFRSAPLRDLGLLSNELGC